MGLSIGFDVSIFLIDGGGCLSRNGGRPGREAESDASKPWLVVSNKANTSLLINKLWPTSPAISPASRWSKQPFCKISPVMELLMEQTFMVIRIWVLICSQMVQIPARNIHSLMLTP